MTTTEHKYTTARKAIEELMQAGTWWTTMRLKQAILDRYGVSVSESTVTAKIRDLRKPDYGDYKIVVSRTQSKAGGRRDLYIYRMVLGGA